MNIHDAEGGTGANNAVLLLSCYDINPLPLMALCQVRIDTTDSRISDSQVRISGFNQNKVKRWESAQAWIGVARNASWLSNEKQINDLTQSWFVTRNGICYSRFVLPPIFNHLESGQSYINRCKSGTGTFAGLMIILRCLGIAEDFPKGPDFEHCVCGLCGNYNIKGTILTWI